MNNNLQQMPQSVNQNVPLTTFDTLTRIIAAFSANFGRFHALAIHHPSTRVWAAPHVMSCLIDQRPIDVFPCPIKGPFPVVVVHALVVRKFPWHVPPLAACLGDVQHSIDSFSHIYRNGSPRS